jgi:hypothetical protein
MPAAQTPLMDEPFRSAGFPYRLRPDRPPPTDALDQEEWSLNERLHNGVAQQLTGALLRLQTLEQRHHRNLETGLPLLRAAIALIAEGINEVRAIANELAWTDGDASVDPGSLSRQ